MSPIDDNPAMPMWRASASVTLDVPHTLEMGDPCVGLTPLASTLPAGTWQWHLRDRHADGSREAVAEVRLVRVAPDEVADVDALLDTVPDWDWLDEYGFWSRTPIVDVGEETMRGVDGGIIAWTLMPARGARPLTDLDRAAVDAYDDWLLGGPGDDGPSFGGLAMVTTTGYGDGGYPVVTRVVDGEVVEVRAAYIVPDLAPLNCEDFTRLALRAYDDHHLTPDHEHPLAVAVKVTRYVPDDGSEPREYSYTSTVTLAHLPDDELLERNLPRGFVDKVRLLWDRTTPESHTDLVANCATGETQTTPVTPTRRIPTREERTDILTLTL